MDYVVGSVAALISGNVTPSRPKLTKRALTPTKHQPSPNVTPKSEYVNDRSIFLSPTLLKKKAIVKKSPKRIFENQDLDTTVDETKNSLTSPVDKAKKHLKNQLETDDTLCTKMESLKSAKKNNIAVNIENIQNSNETPLKKKKKQSKIHKDKHSDKIKELDIPSNVSLKIGKSENESFDHEVNENHGDNTDLNNTMENNSEPTKTKKNKKRKIKNKHEEVSVKNTQIVADEIKIKKKKSKVKDSEINEVVVNPNAVTSQDTDSEHESDHEIQSEDDHKQSLDIGPVDSSEDEDEKVTEKKGKNKIAKEVKPNEAKAAEPDSDEEIKRTLFVGNVLYKSKTKKDIKKLFSQYGDIDTVRIRAVPVKDATMTPKLAIIKNELHPERTTVNVYVKFRNPESVEKALAANNTVLDGHHLRVTRSDITGTLDTKCSIFIGNLPFAIEDEALRAKFEKCGEIESVRIIRDEKTGAGKGFGYVNFKSKDAVELALSLTDEDLTIKNRILRVNRCLQIHNNNNGRNKRHGGNNTKFGNNRNNQNGTDRNGGNNRNDGINRYRGNNRNLDNRNIGNGNRGFARNAPGKFDRSNDQKTGAFRRIANKRINQNEGEGPVNKRGKKERKEFVGRTAEKKKKGKFNKDQKKKKALSEILTK